MKLQVKIMLISFVAVILLGSLLAFADQSTHRSSEYFVYIGVVGFFAGLLQLVVGLLLLLMQDKRYAQGCLLSGGLLMLAGFATCTANFTLNIH